jgi:hypothetical protein
MNCLRRESVGKFLVFETGFITTATELDDLVHIVWRDVTTSNITVIVVLSVKRADDVCGHGFLV